MNGCTHSLGTRGEELSARFLEQQGYKILARNYRTFFGEVDIVAVRGNTVSFIEVKAWDAFPFSDLEYAVNRRKQSRIIRASEWFLKGNPHYDGFMIRYDVIFLSGGKIDVIEDAFRMD